MNPTSSGGGGGGNPGEALSPSSSSRPGGQGMPPPSRVGGPGGALGGAGGGNQQVSSDHVIVVFIPLSVKFLMVIIYQFVDKFQEHNVTTSSEKLSSQNKRLGFPQSSLPHIVLIFQSEFYS